MKKYTAPATIFIFITLLILPFAARAQTQPIRVLKTSTANNFPDGLTFTITAEADLPIVRAKLFFRSTGNISTNSQPVDITPGTHITAKYTWDTSRATVPPSTPIEYFWQLEDEAGNRLKTGKSVVNYDDNRFEWQEISSPQLSVRWYDGDAKFGQTIFDAGTRALAQMETETGLQPESQIKILLYANDADFASWHFFVQDWVGGQAFPAIGVTTQIVPPSTSKKWIENVIPHEITHLFFYQTINTDSNSWPKWLDEGLAQYYEFADNNASQKHVEQAARRGELIPLVLLSGDFGSDSERVRLAYDESYSVVRYLMETWGADGLRALVAGFRDGKGTREAVAGAFGKTWEEFEAGWITWLGVPATPAPAPTPTPTFVYLQAPNGWPTPTKTRHTATPTPPAVAAAPSATPAATHSPTATPMPVSGGISWGTVVGVWCFCAFGLIVLVAVVIILRRRKSN